MSVLPSGAIRTSSMVLLAEMIVRAPPPLTGTICTPCRPRSSTVKNSRAESGDQVKPVTQRSTPSVIDVSLPLERSSTTRRQRSLS